MNVTIECSHVVSCHDTFIFSHQFLSINIDLNTPLYSTLIPPLPYILVLHITIPAGGRILRIEGSHVPHLIIIIHAQSKKQSKYAQYSFPVKSTRISQSNHPTPVKFYGISCWWTKYSNFSVKFSSQIPRSSTLALSPSSPLCTCSCYYTI